MQKLNLKDLEECFYGETEINRIMYGDKEVWYGAKAVYLGYNTSFTVNSSVYRNYLSLSADDFFISPTEGRIILASHTCGCWDGSSCNGCCQAFSDSITFKKTWSPSTQTFTCNFGGQSVYAWIIPHSSDLISKGRIKKVGTGQSFTVTGIASDYKSCTKNNFLFRTLNYAVSSYDCCSYNCPNSLGFTKSYTPSNGSLVAHTDISRLLSAGSLETTPYYIPTFILGE